MWSFSAGRGCPPKAGFRIFAVRTGCITKPMISRLKPFCLMIFYSSIRRNFIGFYRDKLIYQGILPNATHKILAKWEQEGFLKAVVTQNIDGLHSLAGSRRVFELHGSIERNFCVSCGKKYGLEAVEKGQGIPRCSCGGMIRPDVVLYGEGLEDAVLTGAVREISRADVLIVGGTSLAVYPAAGLLRYFQGSRLVLINRTETPYDSRADVVIHAGLGQVMTWLDEGGDPACFGKEQES